MIELVRQWLNDNQGVLAIAVPIAGTMLVALWRFLRAHQKSLPPDLTVANYLRQLDDHLVELQRHPLHHDEKELVALAAELVEPRYRVSFLAGAERNQRDGGRLTHDLVSVLLKRERRPVVVLGDPGSGKSVSLRQVARELVRRGLEQSRPLIPIYCRLGTFTEPIRDPQTAALDFVRQSLQKLGGHAHKILEHFDQYLHEGRLVFLLDAMDEMPRVDLGNRYAALGELRKYAANRLMLACRQNDFREAFGSATEGLHALPFVRAYIQPLSRRQIKRFLRKALGLLGGEAARKILAPSNALRDLAPNPFFLKLLALYYGAFRELPPSRARLLEAFAETMFERARGRADFPAELDFACLQAVLAAVAYLTTASKRGVTLPLQDVRREFARLVESGDDRDEPVLAPALRSHVARLEDALRVATSEKLVRREQDGAAEVLMFQHHRLQEYYTALYLDLYNVAIDWEPRLENIWWQQTLVMLFGITKDPSAHATRLLERFCGRPITCRSVGTKLAALLRPSDEDEQRSKVVDELRSLDAEGLYGLRDAIAPGTDPDALHWQLYAMNILAGPLRDLALIRILQELSPEPDVNEHAERVREWLEPVNRSILDRLELAAECLQNARHRLSAAIVQRLTPVLKTFADEGNLWESVRAVRIASRVPGIDLFDVLEPVLLRGHAWSRHEAMDALSRFPAGESYRAQTSLLLFLRFIKGELLTSLPRFITLCRDRPENCWLVPGVMLLAAASVGVLLLPLTIASLLRHLYPTPLAPFHGLWGLGWSDWIVVIQVAAAAGVYILRANWKVPIVRSVVLVALLCALIPAVVEAAPRLAPNKDSGIADHGLWTAACLGVVAALWAPLLVEWAYAALTACVAAVLFLAPGVLRAVRVYWQGVVPIGGPLLVIMCALSIVPAMGGLIAPGLVAMWVGMPGFFAWGLVTGLASAEKRAEFRREVAASVVVVRRLRSSLRETLPGYLRTCGAFLGLGALQLLLAWLLLRALPGQEPYVKVGSSAAALFYVVSWLKELEVYDELDERVRQVARRQAWAIAAIAAAGSVIYGLARLGVWAAIARFVESLSGSVIAIAICCTVAFLAFAAYLVVFARSMFVFTVYILGLDQPDNADLEQGSGPQRFQSSRAALRRTSLAWMRPFYYRRMERAYKEIRQDPDSTEPE